MKKIANKHFLKGYYFVLRSNKKDAVLRTIKGIIENTTRYGRKLILRFTSYLEASNREEKTWTRYSVTPPMAYTLTLEIVPGSIERRGKIVVFRTTQDEECELHKMVGLPPGNPTISLSTLDNNHKLPTHRLWIFFKLLK